MVATGSPSPSRKRPFALFVADTSDGLRREVRHDVRRRGLPSAYDVDDVVQTAYAQLLPVYEQLPTEYAAFNYAHRTALHALSDARRRDRVRHDGWLEEVHERHGRQPLDPETEALRGLRVAAVRRALRRLPISQRRAVTLVDLAELRQADAAEEMGVSPTTLKGLVQRGRARLRLELSEAPGLAVLARLRKPSVLAPVATAPSLVVMAALCLTVLHTPVVPARVPYVSVPGASQATPAALRNVAKPVTVVRPATVRPVAKAAVPARQQTASQPAAQSITDSLPDAGGCVDWICTPGAEFKGDNVCVETGHEPKVPCANQSLVGVCPAAAAAEPYVTCERYTDPEFDPLPPP